VLETLESLMVRQQVEPLQVFIGLETENRYKILDNAGNEILFAYEESGFLGRQFLGGHRPLTIKIMDGQGNLQLIAQRKFFWFFWHLELLSPEGAVLGRMQRRFKIIGRRFDLFDDQEKVGTVEGPLLRPNTFWIKRDGIELAKITKKWSGIAREAFTAADNFSAEYTDSSLSESHRWLVLGTAFAIGLDYFENRDRFSLGFGTSASSAG